jgi:hypothetical protein
MTAVHRCHGLPPERAERTDGERGRPVWLSQFLLDFLAG